MKPAWMKFWLCASTLAMVFSLGMVVSAGAAAQKPKKARGSNELTLSAIQPGKDKFAGVEKKLGERLRILPADSSSAHMWEEACTGKRLTLEVDKDGVIQSVDVTSPRVAPAENCKESKDAQRAQLWVTGQGLRLDDKVERVIDVYGQPSSSGPSVKDGRELELMFYMFDWAGSDVPQVLEVSCEKNSGRVVEILLAFPSL